MSLFVRLRQFLGPLAIRDNDASGKTDAGPTPSSVSGASRADERETHPNRGGGKQLIVTGDDLLQMTRQEAKSRISAKAWDIVALDRLYSSTLANARPPRPASLPKIYISYMRENSEHMTWVNAFACHLVERGYEVVFDQFVENEDSEFRLLEFMCRMVECNFFFPILTELYITRIPSGEAYSKTGRVDAGWVFDEWRLAWDLAGRDRLKFLGILRSGSEIPPPFKTESIIDFRDDSQFIETLNLRFPWRYRPA